MNTQMLVPQYSQPVFASAHVRETIDERYSFERILVRARHTRLMQCAQCRHHASTFLLESLLRHWLALQVCIANWIADTVNRLALDGFPRSNHGLSGRDAVSYTSRTVRTPAIHPVGAFEQIATISNSTPSYLLACVCVEFTRMPACLLLRRTGSVTYALERTYKIISIRGRIAYQPVSSYLGFHLVDTR